MWMRVTLGLIAVLGLLLIVMTLTGTLSVKVELPPGSEPTNPAWMAAWLFVLFSAVIIVGVTIVRLVVRLFRPKPISK